MRVSNKSREEQSRKKETHAIKENTTEKNTHLQSIWPKRVKQKHNQRQNNTQPNQIVSELRALIDPDVVRVW
jgi:hypothetical protein